MINRAVTLISNTPDDDHCAQAIYAMILSYFKSNNNLTLDQISALTGYEQGKGSWTIGGALWFSCNGFDVEVYTLFDFHRFFIEGREYLRHVLPGDLVESEIADTNIPAEQERAQKIKLSGIVKHRLPVIEDITQAINEGCLVHCGVDSNILDEQDGTYWGHAVLVTGYDDDHLIIQDPGLPSEANRYVKNDVFDRAWLNPIRELREMITYRLK